MARSLSIYSIVIAEKNVGSFNILLLTVHMLIMDVRQNSDGGDITGKELRIPLWNPEITLLISIQLTSQKHQVPRKTRNIKYILYFVLLLLLISCSCSDSLYTSYSGRSKNEARKCSAKVSTVNALFIYKRW